MQTSVHMHYINIPTITKHTGGLSMFLSTLIYIGINVWLIWRAMYSTLLILMFNHLIKPDSKVHSIFDNVVQYNTLFYTVHDVKHR